MLIPKREYDRVMAKFNHFKEYQDVKAAKEEVLLLLESEGHDNLPEAMLIDAVMNGRAQIDYRDRKPLDEFMESLK